MLYAEYKVDGKFFQFTGTFEEWWEVSFRPDISIILIKKIV